jgi:hypothetical protein
MEIQEVILARAIRLVKVSTAIGYWPDLVKDLGKEYSFATVPDIQEVIASQNKGTAAKGAEFQVGKLTRPDGSMAVIEKFTVFNDGLVVDSRVSTEDCDLFLDSIEQWAMKNLSGIRNVGKSFYLSQLEVKFQGSQYTKAFDGICSNIHSLLEEYGMTGVTRYRFASLHLAMEPSRTSLSQPSPFSIERRLNVPFDDNVFFAQAPLRTPDHKTLLAALEQVLAAI